MSQPKVSYCGAAGSRVSDPMPRYFFHVHDTGEIIDDIGVALPGLDEACAMALAAGGEALGELGPTFWANPEWQMWVTDENGVEICTLAFSAERGSSS